MSSQLLIALGRRLSAANPALMIQQKILLIHLEKSIISQLFQEFEKERNFRGFEKKEENEEKCLSLFISLFFFLSEFKLAN